MRANVVPSRGREASASQVARKFAGLIYDFVSVKQSLLPIRIARLNTDGRKVCVCVCTCACV